jgi:hypothetical protein
MEGEEERERERERERAQPSVVTHTCIFIVSSK